MLDIENKFLRYKAEVTSQECFWRITYLPFSSFFAVSLHEQLSSIFLKKIRECSLKTSNWNTRVMEMATSLQTRYNQ